MKKISVCGVVAVTVLAIGNALHLPFSIWLFSEQAQTGFGFGTNIGMGALIVWLAEFICIPFALAGITLFIISIIRQARVPITVANAVLLSLLLLQISLTNLFMNI
jgi:hypothetical protein